MSADTMEQHASTPRKWRITQEQSLLAIIVLVVAVFGAATPQYLSLSNLLNIGQQTAVIATVAYAMTAVIICKGIDISVGSVLAASGVVAALVMQSTGLPGWLGVLLVIAIGAAFGLLNGVLVSYVGISPFVTTLAVYAFARGVALSFSGSQSVSVSSGVYLWFGQASLGGIPVSLLVAAALAGFWLILLHRTMFGRWLYATGGNEEAARASLIPVRAVRMFVYVLAGASAGLGSMLTTGRVGSAQPLAGTGLEFAAITAAIIGGTRLAGGQGSIAGTALGAVLLGAVNTGLAFLQVSQQVTYFVTGGFVLVAVLLSQRGTWAMLKGYASWRPAHARASTAAGLVAMAPGAAERAGSRTLELRAVSKRFPGVQALSDVSLQLKGGEVVALVGENGAGKSTLVKVLSGIHRPEHGEILVDGETIELPGPAESRAAGIAVIHQHFSLIPELSVAENLALGQSHLPKHLGVSLNRAEMRRRARVVLDDLQLPVDPDAKVSRLTIGQCQMVEIAKAMMADAWLIVMDEPTSALTNHERDLLYRLVRQLVERRCCVLYISHKMQEVYELASRAVVLRDGHVVGEAVLAQTDEASLIGMMVGRAIKDVFPFRAAREGKVVLAVRRLSDHRLLKDIELEVRGGELVALTGLMGSGRSELMRCVAGMANFSEGSIELGGTTLRAGDAKDASRLGAAYVPEDRHKEGLVGTMSLRDNIGMRWIRHHSKAGFLPRRALDQLAAKIIAQLGVRPPDPGNLAANLSGGNQQKIVIGKWLATAPKLLLLDEPTNGVDVGAKFEIHNLIADLKQQGVAILMVSSELPEVLGVADRIVVLSGGRVAGELPRGASEEQVMSLAFKYA
jgi:ribose transport system ATP-binding protein